MLIELVVLFLCEWPKKIQRRHEAILDPSRIALPRLPGYGAEHLFWATDQKKILKKA